MGINWNEYDAFAWHAAKQSAMTADECAAVEELALRVLKVSDAASAGAWGTASPPGRFASTVVQIEKGIEHAFSGQAAAAGLCGVGLKIYKANSDARREFEKVLPFHKEQIHGLPGLPNARVQQTLDAKWEVDSRGERRGVVVQQWVDGSPLDDVLQRQSHAGPLAIETMQSLLRQMFAEIVIPLWSAGLVWWDIRDANWCYDRSAEKLFLIDVDSLAAYADEILETPLEWGRRDKGRETALSRLRQTILRVFAAQITGKRGKFEATVKALWQSDLEPCLRELGHRDGAKDEALRAFEGFLKLAVDAVG